MADIEKIKIGNTEYNVKDVVSGYITGITSSDVTTALGYTPQTQLVSGTNIKTINNNSILGSGNLTLDGLPSQTGQSGKFLTTDGTDASWESVPTRNIGEIVQSTIPLTDAGLHLLDGALIDGNGIYSAFVDYIASIYDASASYFTTEASWQDSVTNYGVCGKFVYDSVNNTVRLPKYSNKIYTKSINSTAPVVGNGKTLGMTNGTSTLGLIKGQPSAHPTPLFSNLAGSNVGTIGSEDSTWTINTAVGVTSDPTKSGLIAQLSNITTSLDGYYYIVIATSTKTDIEVDIDEVATDLNGKADVDLTNVTNSANIKMAHNAMPSDTYIDLTLGASGTSYTAPADGYVVISKTAGSDWYYVNLFSYQNDNSTICLSFFLDGYRTSPIISCIPVRKGQKFAVNYNATGTLQYFRFIYAQGSESEAQ